MNADIWPAPPLVPGNWKTLSLGDACAVLARFTAHEISSKLDPSATVVEYTGVRACRLFGDTDWLLLEAKAGFRDGAQGLLTIFYGPGHRFVPAVWAPYVIRDMLWEEARGKSSNGHLAEYLRLYVNCTSGDEGRFMIVDTDSVAAGVLLDEESLAETVRARIGPLAVTPGADGNLATFHTTTAYGGHLFVTRYTLDAAGGIEMTEDEAIGPVPLHREEITGPFRVFRGGAPHAA